MAEVCPGAVEVEVFPAAVVDGSPALVLEAVVPEGLGVGERPQPLAALVTLFP
jgi:hypothetical protein